MIIFHRNLNEKKWNRQFARGDKRGNMIKDVKSSRDKIFEKRIVEYDENNLPVKVAVTSNSNEASDAQPIIYLLTYQK
ncbi:MAG: hypothetical protein ABI723_22220 [Bacteroidia bacterium]